MVWGEEVLEGEIEEGEDHEGFRQILGRILQILDGLGHKPVMCPWPHNPLTIPKPAY